MSTDTDMMFDRAKIEQLVETYKGDYTVRLFLSTDWKHTIEIEAKGEDKAKAINFALEILDELKLRFGTKQQQNKKTYSVSDDVINFGKYSGQKWSDLPQSYLSWLKENAKSPQIAQRAEKELSK